MIRILFLTSQYTVMTEGRTFFGAPAARNPVRKGPFGSLKNLMQSPWQAYLDPQKRCPLRRRCAVFLIFVICGGRTFSHATGRSGSVAENGWRIHSGRKIPWNLFSPKAGSTGVAESQKTKNCVFAIIKIGSQSLTNKFALRRRVCFPSILVGFPQGSMVFLTQNDLVTVPINFCHSHPPISLPHCFLIANCQFYLQFALTSSFHQF